jgi:hypothetical protein
MIQSSACEKTSPPTRGLVYFFKYLTGQACNHLIHIYSIFHLYRKFGDRPSDKYDILCCFVYKIHSSDAQEELLETHELIFKGIGKLVLPFLLAEDI